MPPPTAIEIHIGSPAEFDTLTATLAAGKRMVFFAGLPGVGKSLLVRELARAARAHGRTVHLLQWDVVRPALESPALRARYPEVNGIAHAMIRRAAGLWVRDAVVRWHDACSDPSHILIGEVPLVGNRLLELAQVTGDAAESLLAGDGALFVLPVPSIRVRAEIEAARTRSFAAPTHAREAADATPSVLISLWQEVHRLALRLGTAPADPDAAAYDPSSYAAVYAHLLRHRHALTVWMDAVLAPRTSVYDVGAALDVVPARSEADAVVARLEREPGVAAVAQQVAEWFERT